MLGLKRRKGMELPTGVMVSVVLVVIGIFILLTIYFVMSKKAAPWLADLPKSILSALV